MTDGFGGYDPTFDHAAAHALNTLPVNWAQVDAAEFQRLQSPVTLANGAVVNAYVGGIKAKLAAGDQPVSMAELAYARYEGNGGVTAFVNGGVLANATGNPNAGGRTGLCYFNPSGIGWLTIAEAQQRGDLLVPLPVTFTALPANDPQSAATSPGQTVSSDQVKVDPPKPVDVPAPVTAPVAPAAPVVVNIHNAAPSPTSSAAPVQPVTWDTKVKADLQQRESKLIADLKAASVLDWLKFVGIAALVLKAFWR